MGGRLFTNEVYEKGGGRVELWIEICTRPPPWIRQFRTAAFPGHWNLSQSYDISRSGFDGLGIVWVRG